MQKAAKLRKLRCKSLVLKGFAVRDIRFLSKSCLQQSVRTFILRFFAPSSVRSVAFRGVEDSENRSEDMRLKVVNAVQGHKIKEQSRTYDNGNYVRRPSSGAGSGRT